MKSDLIGYPKRMVDLKRAAIGRVCSLHIGLRLLRGDQFAVRGPQENEAQTK
jgi:hypothetical protein